MPSPLLNHLPTPPRLSTHWINTVVVRNGGTNTKSVQWTLWFRTDDVSTFRLTLTPKSCGGKSEVLDSKRKRRRTKRWVGVPDGKA